MAELSLQQAFEMAGQKLQAGELGEAEALYREILKVLPGHPDVLQHLGIVASQAGFNEQAVELIAPVVEQVSDPAAAYNNLGLALSNLGRLAEAHAAFTRALGLRPDYPEALSNLGVVLLSQGLLDEATAAQRQAAKLSPGFLQPKIRLIDLTVARGCAEEGVALALEVLRDFPEHPVVLNALGAAYELLKRLPEALDSYSRAVAVAPDYAEAHLNVGNILKDLGRDGEALAAYEASLALNPKVPAVYNNLGVVLASQGELDDAISRYRQALELGPGCAAIYNNLAGTLKDVGAHREALAHYRRALELEPMMLDARSNLLLALHYSADTSQEEVLSEHHEWGRVQAEPWQAERVVHANSKDPERRLKVGYVSPDLNDHPVGRLILPILENHDPEVVEVFAYAQVRKPDEMTERLKGHVSQWRDVGGLSDAELAEMVRADGIDLLVDLAGHTRNQRLLVFARKPAPVQATYLGYPDTTGVRAIDYRLSDWHADPPGAERWCVENLLRLDPCAWCFSPLPEVEATRAPGAPLTLGTFNQLVKVTEPMLRLWARVLRELPEARLLLKGFAWRSQIPRRRALELFAAEGVAAERIELYHDVLDYHAHLAFHGRLDIALDTFPYHGTNMTFEALWMGRPVITLAGKSHVSRVGVSLLTNAGHPEWVAATEDEYVAKVVELAGDRPRLAAIHAGLRDELRASPLMDGVAMARRLENAYRGMWHKWCAAGSDA